MGGMRAGEAPYHAPYYVPYPPPPGAYAALSSCVYKFDHWLEMLLDDGVPLQDLAPGLVAEYARDVLANGGAPPPGASIVCFPLEPKPHDVATPWVAAHWR